MGWLAADTVVARCVRAARTMRLADHPHCNRGRYQHWQYLQRPMAGREGLLQALVADRTLLLDRRRHRLDPRYQRIGGRLARLRPRAENGEGRQPDLR